MAGVQPEITDGSPEDAHARCGHEHGLAGGGPVYSPTLGAPRRGPVRKASAST